MIIVFILMFFPWVGYFPGGMPVATQTAWQAAFGSYTDDPDLAKDPPVSNADHKDQIQPGFSVFQIFFVVFFQLALVAALGVAVLGVVALPLPAIVERFWPWRWAKVSALALVAFLFLVLQLVGGFNLAKGIRDRIQTIGAEHAKTVEANSDPAAKVAAKKEAQSETGLHADAVRYTCAFWTSFWLTLLAVICAVWTYLLSRRPSRPLPRIELVW